MYVYVYEVTSDDFHVINIKIFKVKKEYEGKLNWLLTPRRSEGTEDVLWWELEAGCRETEGGRRWAPTLMPAPALCCEASGFNSSLTIFTASIVVPSGMLEVTISIFSFDWRRSFFNNTNFISSLRNSSRSFRRPRSLSSTSAGVNS